MVRVLTPFVLSACAIASEFVPSACMALMRFRIVCFCRFAVAEFNCACNVSGKVIEPPLHPPLRVELSIQRRGSPLSPAFWICAGDFLRNASEREPQPRLHVVTNKMPFDGADEFLRFTTDHILYGGKYKTPSVAWQYIWLGRPN